MTTSKSSSTDRSGSGELSNAGRVREFHEAIGEFPPTGATVPDEALLALRRKLVEEEFDEVMEALDALRDSHGGEAEERLVKAAHELTDLLYVTYGALVWMGVDADAVFAEVHAANMRKTTGPKRADGKQLKPEGWQPANVRAVIGEVSS